MNVKLEFTREHETAQGRSDDQWVLMVNEKNFLAATAPRDILLLAIAMKLGVELEIHDPARLDKTPAVST